VSITTYSTLVSAVTEYLARDQDTTLVARIPDFIILCEAKLDREIRHARGQKRSYTTFDTTDTEPEFVTLPTDFKSMKRLRLSGVSGKPTLDYMSQRQLDEFRYSIGDATGQPRFFTIFGSEIEAAPVPDDDYEIEIVYDALLSGLNDSNSTNWLIDIAPDVYLYGTLLEAAPYMRDIDGMLPIWAAGFSSAVESLNRDNLSMQFNAQPLVMRTSGATP
jgi:hypothetical protein